MKTLAATVALLFATCFTARAGEVTIENIGEALQLLESATAGQECSNLIDESHANNSAQLFYSAAVCAKEERNTDASFFLIAGQIRSTADMELYEPVSTKDQEVVGTLYGLIFYHFGGAGDQSIYRDSTRHAAFMTQVAAWAPHRSESYNPGWNFKSSPQEAKYKQAIASAKQQRFTQLTNYSKLIRDESYYAAQQEFSELQSKNPQGFMSDTEDGRRAEELLNTTQQREREITGEN